MGSEEDGEVSTGYVPCFLNGERVELIIAFDSEHPSGYIAGATTVYTDEETETVAKNLVAAGEGDELEFICDYYDYDGNYTDSYLLGEKVVLGSEPEIRNVTIRGGKLLPTYRFTDIYQNTFWTPVFEP